MRYRLAILVLALGVAAIPAAAQASTVVLVNEPFTTVTPSSSNWSLPSAPTGANVACLTAGTSTSASPMPGCGLSTPDASGSGALRLTPSANTQEGGVAYKLSVPTTDGIDATFNTYQYGHAGGADGIGFFLAAADPADPQPPANIGQSGGALGYSGWGASAGMAYGYLGIGLDVYGNYANASYEGTGCTDPGWDDSGSRYPNNVSVRGPGAGTAGYCMLSSTAAAGGLSSGTLDGGAGGTRTTSQVPVEVVINPSSSAVTSAWGLTVPADSYEVAFTPIGGSRQTLGGTLPSVAGFGFPASWYDSATGIPYQLTFGWVGSTGGAIEIHEVNDVQSATVTGIPATLTAAVTDDAAGAPANGSTIDYNVTVGNQAGTSDDPGPISVTDTLPSGATPSATGLGTNGWSCSISGQTVSCQHAGPLASGATLPALAIPAAVTAGAGTQLTNTATASSAASAPATARDTVTVATPPTDTSTCGSANGQNGWFVSDPTCTARGTDPNPAVDHVAYQLDGGAVIATSSGTTSATVQVTTDGTHALKTEVFNTSGQNSGWRTQTVKVDTTPPSDASTCGNPDGQNGYFVTDPTCTIHGTDATSGVDHVAYQLDNGTITTTSSGTTTAAVPITTDGTHTLKTRIYDAAGNSTGWSTQTINVDTTPPSDTSTCGNPDGQNGYFVTDPTCTIHGTDATSGVDHVAYQLDNGTITTTSSGTTTAAVPITTDGTHTLKTRIYDAAGNSTGWSTQTINVDTTPPSDTSTCGNPDGQNGYFVTDPTCTIHGTDATSGVDHVAYQLDNGTITTSSSGTTTATVQITTDGTHTLKTRIYDAAGNDSGWRTQTVTVDTTAPAAPVINAPADGSISSNVAPVVLVSGEPGAGATVEVDGVDYGPVTLDGSGDGHVQIPGPLSPAPHTVRARQTDVAGNVGPWSATSTFTVKTATSVTLSGPTGGPTNVATPTVDYTGEAGDQFTVTVDGQTVATGVIPAGGAGSLTLPAALADGRHTIAIAVTDAVGNQASASIVVTIDTVAPGTPSIVSAPGQLTADTSATFSFADTASPANYECSLDSGAWSACSTPVTFSSLSDGPHTLLVRTRDGAGEVSASAQYAWTVTATAPPAPTILGGPPERGVPAPATFQISSQPDTTLSCSLDGGPFRPCGTLVNLATLPVGEHTLAVRQIDEAGDVSASAVYRWGVMRRRGPHGLPRAATLLIASPATAAGAGTLHVGCNLNAGSIRRCRVLAFFHGAQVGDGVASQARRGDVHTIVTVRLNATGRALLGRALGGLPLTLAGRAEPFGFAPLPARSQTVLYEPLRFLLPDVLFKFDSWQLTPAARAIVRALAAQLSGARTVVCEGNTDSYGSDAYNERIGMRRAETVCAALRALGVHARMRSVSNGELRPVASNATAHGRGLNRRVVVRVSYADLGPRAASLSAGSS